MAEHLYLRVHARPTGEHVEWLMLDETSGVVRLRGDGDWDAFENLTSEMTHTGETRVLVPGEHVLTTRATIPGRQMRQVLQAIPFMVEEHLASDVEDCHFAAGARARSGETEIAVIDRERMLALTERLAAAGLHADSLTADCQQVSDEADINVLVDDTRALVRTRTGRSVAMELDVLPMVLPGFGPGDVRIEVHSSAAARLEMITSQIDASLDGGAVTVVEIDYSPFEWLCRSYRNDAINLLQGEFRAAERHRSRRQGWKSVAVLAACAVGLHLMLLIVQGIYLDVKADEYEREARAIYTAVFPGDTDVRDLRRRWQSRLSAGSGQQEEGFLDLFGQAARLLPGSGLRLENINFNENRGDLTLQLVASGSDPFVRFTQTLADAGLDAEVGTINQDGSLARGSIRIRL